MKDRKHKRFCSKHQAVHFDFTNYWSCRFPNDKEKDKSQVEWQKNPMSIE